MSKRTEPRTAATDQPTAELAAVMPVLITQARAMLDKGMGRDEAVRAIAPLVPIVPNAGETARDKCAAAIVSGAMNSGLFIKALGARAWMDIAILLGGPPLVGANATAVRTALRMAVRAQQEQEYARQRKAARAAARARGN